MKYVLDSSVAVKLELPEIDSTKAVRLRDAARAGLYDLLVPDFFPTEAAHAITRAERRGRITPAQGRLALTALLSELPAIQDSVPVLQRAYDISSRYQIGVYDCVYVAVAESENCEFIVAI